MEAKTLAQLRAEYRQAEAAYHAAMRHYVAAYEEVRARDVLEAHIAQCHACGATLDAALATLIDALWAPLNDPVQRAEQRRLTSRRALLASELVLLSS